MQLTLREIDLPLRHAFTISQGTTTVQKNLLVALSDGGFTGYGEGASSHAYAAFTAPGVRVEKGQAVFPTENGNGVRLLPEFA